MIDFSLIKKITRSKMNDSNLEFLSSFFNEKASVFFDKDLDESYVIFPKNGVSILYNDESDFESLFFHFKGDDDTDDCPLNVLGLDASSSIKDIEKMHTINNYVFVKEIPRSHEKLSMINHSLIFKKDDIYMNAELDEKDNILLLTFMTSESYPL